MSEDQTVSLSGTLSKYDISLSPGKVKKIEVYASSLWEWNEKLNLTRHTDWEKFVTRDLIDSIHLAALLQKGESILDVGTGGGVPGVLVSILRPDLRVDLCDATGKKTAALGEILDVVGMKNNLWHAKAEELLKVRRYHTLVIRAVSKMDKLLAMFAPYWHAFDRILMIKGPAWVEERGTSRHLGLLNSLALRKVDEYINPGAEHESVILQVCRKSRFLEMKKREEDLANGVAIDPIPEELAVDNRAESNEISPRSRFSGARGKRSKWMVTEKKYGKGWVHPETPFKRLRKQGKGQPR